MTGQAVSADGEQIVFVAAGHEGTPQLWIRRLDSLNARLIAGTEGAAQPFWSPDGRFIGFFAAGKLKTIGLAGGPPQTLAAASLPLGGTWNRDGVILFGQSPRKFDSCVPAGGGATTQVTGLVQTSGIVAHASPFFLPDGRHFFFVAATGPTAGDTYIGSLDSHDAKLLLRSDFAAVYSPSGHVLFLRESTLMAQRFDPQPCRRVARRLPGRRGRQVLLEHQLPRLGQWDVGVQALRWPRTRGRPG